MSWWTPIVEAVGSLFTEEAAKAGATKVAEGAAGKVAEGAAIEAGKGIATEAGLGAVAEGAATKVAEAGVAEAGLGEVISTAVNKPTVAADMSFSNTLAGANEKKIMSGLTGTAEKATGLDITGTLDFSSKSLNPTEFSLDSAMTVKDTNPLDKAISQFSNDRLTGKTTPNSFDTAFDKYLGGSKGDAMTGAGNVGGVNTSAIDRATAIGTDHLDAAKSGHYGLQFAGTQGFDGPKSKGTSMSMPSLGKPKGPTGQKGSSARQSVGYSPYTLKYDQSGLKALQQAQTNKNRQLLGLYRAGK